MPRRGSKRKKQIRAANSHRDGGKREGLFTSKSTAGLYLFLRRRNRHRGRKGAEMGKREGIILTRGSIPDKGVFEQEGELILEKKKPANREIVPQRGSDVSLQSGESRPNTAKNFGAGKKCIMVPTGPGQHGKKD